MASSRGWMSTMGGYLRAVSSLQSALNQLTQHQRISKMAPIERVTLFKIPNDSDRQRVLEQFKVLVKTATKVSLFCRDTRLRRVLTKGFRVGRQAIHHSRGRRPLVRRPSHPRLQPVRQDDLPVAGRHEVLRYRL